jgi:hypothetical protein
MKLVSLAEYRRLVYADGSGPNLKTLRRRIRDIPGGRIELGRYFVDIDANERLRVVGHDAQVRLTEIMNDPLMKAMQRDTQHGTTPKRRK